MDGWDVLARAKADPGAALASRSSSSRCSTSAARASRSAPPIPGQAGRAASHVVACAARRPATAAQVAGAGAGLDDDPLALELLAAVLEPAGYDVLAAGRRRGGAGAGSARGARLVILDLRCHEVDGFAVVERLRADPRTAALPIVVLTAKTMTAEEGAAATAGSATWPRRASSAARVRRAVRRGSARGRAGEVMAGETILIVEDNERNMKLARDVLQFSGFRTWQAAHGRGGHRAGAHQPALVLMDIQLPGRTASPRLGRAARRPATAAIPVVALTAFAMNGRPRALPGRRLRRLPGQADRGPAIAAGRSSTPARRAGIVARR